MEEKVDFRTPLQIERDKRDAEIYTRYKEIESAYPDKSQWMLWRALSNEFTPLSPMGIRFAIEREKKKNEIVCG
jgi:hypothetical protein